MEREEILLKEYETCQSHINSIGSQVWVSTTIFLTINVTLLSGLLYSFITKNVFSLENINEIVKLQILGPRIAVTALGIGIIVVLHRWKQWMKRMKFHTAVNFDRMGTIERRLGMSRHTISRRLDKFFKNKKRWTPVQKKNSKGRRKFWEFSRESGFDGLNWIALIVIILWVLSIVYVWFPIIKKLLNY
jgi:hypothetical protein